MFKKLNLEKNQLKIGVLFSYFYMGVGFLVYFFLTPFILSKVGKIEYGLYSLLLSIINYLNLLEFGLNSAYIRYYLKFKSEKNYNKIQKLNSTFLLIFSITGIIAVIFCLLFYLKPELILKQNLNIEQILKMKRMFFIALFMVFFSFVNIIFNCYLIANEKFIFQRGMQLLKIVVEPLIIILFLNFEYKILGIIYTKTFITIFFTLINIVYCMKKIKMKFSLKILEIRYIKEMLSFSSFIFLQMIMDQILWNVDKIILSKVVGVTEVTVYSLAAQINNYYIMIATAVSGVFISKVNRITFSTEHSENEKNILLSDLMGKIGRIQFLILLPVLLTLIFFGKKFIILWVGTDYIGSYFITLLLIIPITFPLLQTVGVEIERAKNMQKFMCIVGTLLAVFNLLVSIPLARLYGGIGSAIGTAVSLIVGFLFIRNWYYEKKIGLDVKKFFMEIFKFFPAVLLIIIFGILIVKILKITNFFQLLLSIIVFNIIYIIVMWLMGMNDFEKELVLKPIRNILNRRREI